MTKFGQFVRFYFKMERRSEIFDGTIPSKV